jgi:hypothetical protein
MRIALLVALLATAVPAGAQTEPQITPNVLPRGEIQAKAAIAECDRLIFWLRNDPPPPNSGLTVEQAEAWRQAAEPQPCRDALDRLENHSGLNH